MVKFEDLSPEDKEELLKQARQLIDEENMAKNAVAMYKMKRKNYTDSCLDEIYQTFNVGGRYLQRDKNAIKTRFVSMVNFLFKANILGKEHAVDNYVITNSFEWERYTASCDIVKEAMIKMYQFGKTTE
jgi:hypothetical protein